MVRISDIQNGEVLWNSVPFCYINDDEIPTYELKKNDILFARTGGTVGKSFLVKDTPFRAIYAGYLIRTRYSQELVPQYLKFFMESQLYWEQLKNGTIATAQPNCNGKTLSKMFLPIPPKSEQARIVKMLGELKPFFDKFEDSEYHLRELNTKIKAQLKQSILQQAIQGLLVEQNPDDEPASVLLERITAEKRRLINEKIIKRDKQESIIYRGDDNKYYENLNGQLIVIECDTQFPQSWQLCRLSYICQLIDGTKKNGKQICLDAKYLRGKSEGTILEQGKFVNKGDNIILVDGENSGEVFTVPINGYLGSTFKQLWVNSAMDLQYILYVIRFYKEMLRNSKKGAAIPHLNKQLFYNIIVGIPPIEEQSRIVEKVNYLFQLIV